MDKKSKKHGGVQVDIYGNPVHVPEGKSSFRMAKCGKCGEIVKLSQTKMHLSFGRKLNICKRCLGEASTKRSSFGAIIRELPSSRMLNAIESYNIGMG